MGVALEAAAAAAAAAEGLAVVPAAGVTRPSQPSRAGCEPKTKAERGSGVGRAASSLARWARRSSGRSSEK